MTLFPLALTKICLPVSRRMTPFKQSDIEDDFVPMINFIIHLCWISCLSITTWSALAYYYRVFYSMINNWKAKMMLWIPFVLVLIWALSSVGPRHCLAFESGDMPRAFKTKLRCVDLTCDFRRGLASKPVLDHWSEYGIPRQNLVHKLDTLRCQCSRPDCSCSLDHNEGTSVEAQIGDIITFPYWNSVSELS